MNDTPNEHFVAFTVKLTKRGPMTTTDGRLEILEAGTELTVKDMRKRAIAENEDDWAEVTAKISGRDVDGFIPLELLQSFAGLLPNEPAQEHVLNYPRRADCPSMSEFPLMRRVLGSTQIELGHRRAELQTALSNLEETGKTPTGVHCKLKIEGSVALDVSGILLDFENEVLIRCRIIYRYAPVGNTPLPDLKREMHKLLGSPAGYIEDSEGNKHQAWVKGSIKIATSEEPILHLYTIEFFWEDAPETQTAHQQPQGLRVEKGLNPPSNLIRLLTSDFTGIDYENSGTVDPLFADMVLVGPMFFKRYLGGSLTEQKADRAMFRIKPDVYEGRVLIGMKRVLALADPQFESAMSLYHAGLLRNATDEERLAFYRIIDFEIKGKPVYIIESKAGRLLIYLEENERIKWIEYLDDWRKSQKPELGKLFS